MDVFLLLGELDPRLPLLVTAAVVTVFGVVLVLALMGGDGARRARVVADLAIAGDDAGAQSALGAVRGVRRARVAAEAGRLVANEASADEELDEELARRALALVRGALEDGDEDGPTLLSAARALGRLDHDLEMLAVLTAAVDAPGLDVDTLAALGQLALDAERPLLAEPLFAEALETDPANLDLVAGRAEALLDLGRAAEAMPALAGALQEVHRRARHLDWANQRQALIQRIEALHDHAVRLGACAEKAIDAPLQAGALDPHAGVNYRLLANSMLVDTDRRSRRVLVPEQGLLRAEGEALRARAPDTPDGDEDLGLHRLRELDLDGAEAAFHAALERDAASWPAMMGLGTVLDLRARPLRSLLESATRTPGPDVALLERLVEPWAALTEVERRIVALSVAPLQVALPVLVAAGGRLKVVSCDARIIELPEFAGAAGTQVEGDDDRRTHDAIDGMCMGVTAAVRVDTLYLADEEGWTVAHELGHALHAVLADGPAAEVERLYARALRLEWLSTEYGLTNPFEFFATAYERFALRQVFPDLPRPEVHAADVQLGVDALLRRIASDASCWAVPAAPPPA